MGARKGGTDVEVLDYRTDELAGQFFPATVPGPGVIALSGSDGGCPLEVGRRLAADGFSCLALSYFKADGLPRHLVEVPLDYVEGALGWLARHPSVTGGPNGVIGVSKGAELALLTAAYFPHSVGAAVAYAPSSVAFAGISLGADGRRRSSWSYRGQPVPFVPYAERGARPGVAARGLTLHPIYRAALQDPTAVQAAAIRIENTDARFLLLSGGQDQIWPASEMSESVVARLSDLGRADQIEHLQFPLAGHSFMPWSPQIRWQRVGNAMNAVRLAGVGGGLALGGSPKANREALTQGWSRTVAFLQSSLTLRN